MSRYRYGVGTTIIATVSLSDPDDTTPPVDPRTDNTYLDPDDLTVTVRFPDRTTEVYTYGVDPEIERTDQGRYEARILLAQVGTYKWTWLASTTTKSVSFFGECDSVNG